MKNLSQVSLLIAVLVQSALGKREISHNQYEKVEERLEAVRSRFGARSGAQAFEPAPSRVNQSLANDNGQSHVSANGIDDARGRNTADTAEQVEIQQSDPFIFGVESIVPTEGIQMEMPKAKKQLGAGSHDQPRASTLGIEHSHFNSSGATPHLTSGSTTESVMQAAALTEVELEEINTETDKVHDEEKEYLGHFISDTDKAAYSIVMGARTGDWVGDLMSFSLFVITIAGFFWWAKKIKLHMRYRELIPGVGKLLYNLGIDKAMEFELNLVLREVSYTEQLDTYVMVQAAHNEEVSEQSKMGPSMLSKGSVAANFHDAMQITVPQGCTQVKLKLLDKDKKTVLAEGSTGVDKMLKLGDEDITVTLLRKNKGRKLMRDDPRATISCYCEEGDDPDQGYSLSGGGTSDAGPSERGPPPEKALMQGFDLGSCSLELKLEIEKASRNRAKQLSLKSPPGGHFSDKQMAEHQLEVIAKTCQGKLILLEGFWNRQKQLFFCIFRDGKTSSFLNGWKLGWWERGEPKHIESEPPVDAIPTLYIGKIFPDPGKPDEFTLEYVKDAKDSEPSILHLIRVDRSRELWVECLSVFINHLRKVRISHKEAVKSKKDEEDGGKPYTKKKSSRRRRDSRQKGSGSEGDTGDKDRDAGDKGSEDEDRPKESPREHKHKHKHHDRG